VIVLAGVVVGLWYGPARRQLDRRVCGTVAGDWLAPALYLRNFGNGDFVRDRYMYMPSIGFAILASLALRGLPSIKNWSAQQAQIAAVVVLCGAYGVASLAQQVYWGSDLLLLVRGQSLYPGNPYTMAGLAKEYSQRGANDQAIALAEAVVKDHPEYGYGPLALAESYIRAGRFAEGRVWLNRVNPDYAKSEVGWRVSQGYTGKWATTSGRWRCARRFWRRTESLFGAL